MQTVEQSGDGKYRYPASERLIDDGAERDPHDGTRGAHRDTATRLDDARGIRLGG
jgi:hypothetical protein